MIPLPVIGEPFERIAMDVVEPLPHSHSGHRYVLVKCDYANRYPEAVPMKTVDAEAVAEELLKLFTWVGIPKEILTDQGTNFTSQLLAELYRLLHVNTLRTSSYHPQTDCLIERFNGTLKEMLRSRHRKRAKIGTSCFHAFCLPIKRHTRINTLDSRHSSFSTAKISVAHWTSSRSGRQVPRVTKA